MKVLYDQGFGLIKVTRCSGSTMLVVLSILNFGRVRLTLAFELSLSTSLMIFPRSTALIDEMTLSTFAPFFGRIITSISDDSYGIATHSAKFPIFLQWNLRLIVIIFVCRGPLGAWNSPILTS